VQTSENRFYLHTYEMQQRNKNQTGFSCHLSSYPEYPEGLSEQAAEGEGQNCSRSQLINRRKKDGQLTREKNQLLFWWWKTHFN